MSPGRVSPRHSSRTLENMKHCCVLRVSQGRLRAGSVVRERVNLVGWTSECSEEFDVSAKDVQE